MSAGLLPFRFRDGCLEVLIAHMGGPFWAGRDERAWSIVKGEYDGGEDPYTAAHREFEEEIGAPAPEGPAVALGELRQRSGKRITAWAIEGEIDVGSIKSNTFTLEWPRGSGHLQEFPEIDRAAWMGMATARLKLLQGQLPFLEELERHLALAGRAEPAGSASSQPAEPRGSQALPGASQP